jgi:HAD superfamily hydrolase (TIGR01490 family)
MAEMKEVIAAFDLDGTLTRRDTLIDFLIKTIGYRKLAMGLFVNSPMLMKHLFGIISSETAKQTMFTHFFKGWRVGEFDRQCHVYSSSRLPYLLKGEALSRCDWHKKQGHRLVCVSASIRNWVAPWALQYGFRNVIATEIETDGGMITGRFRGRNCNGPEKVRRFLEIFPERDRYTLFAYGDSRGDEQLLSFADYAFFRRYR